MEYKDASDLIEPAYSGILTKDYYLVHEV